LAAPRLVRWPWSVVASHSICAAALLQSTPHPSPLPEEREPVVGGATARTLAMVCRGESFDCAAVLLQSTPHPSPLPWEREPETVHRPLLYCAGAYGPTALVRKTPPCEIPTPPVLRPDNPRGGYGLRGMMPATAIRPSSAPSTKSETSWGSLRRPRAMSPWKTRNALTATGVAHPRGTQEHGSMLHQKAAGFYLERWVA